MQNQKITQFSNFDIMHYFTFSTQLNKGSSQLNLIPQFVCCHLRGYVWSADAWDPDSLFLTGTIPSE